MTGCVTHINTHAFMCHTSLYLEFLKLVRAPVGNTNISRCMNIIPKHTHEGLDVSHVWTFFSASSFQSQFWRQSATKMSLCSWMSHKKSQNKWLQNHKMNDFMCHASLYKSLSLHENILRLINVTQKVTEWMTSNVTHHSTNHPASTKMSLCS